MHLTDKEQEFTDWLETCPIDFEYINSCFFDDPIFMFKLEEPVNANS